MVRCPNCGEIVSVKAKFCTNCKQPIIKSKTAWEKYKRIWRTETGKPALPGILIVVTIVIIIAIWSTLVIVGGEHEIKVIIDYDGAWQGSIDSTKSLMDVSGEGLREYKLTLHKHDILSVTITKMDDSTTPLLVSIYKDGKQEEERTTIASYGSVLITYSV